MVYEICMNTKSSQLMLMSLVHKAFDIKIIAWKSNG